MHAFTKKFTFNTFFREELNFGANFFREKWSNMSSLYTTSSCGRLQNIGNNLHYRIRTRIL